MDRDFCGGFRSHAPNPVRAGVSPFLMAALIYAQLELGRPLLYSSAQSHCSQPVCN